MNSQSGKITLVGMFPPPTTGAAKNNLIMYDDLRAHDVDVLKLSTSGSGVAHKRGLRYHLDRLVQNAKVFSGLIRVRRGGALYIVPDAGLGMAYSATHLLLSFFKFKNIVIHHRSFLYLYRKSAWMTAIVGLTRRRALHVFLSDGMGAHFERIYGRVPRVTVSNAHYVQDAILAEPQGEQGNNGPLVIGHLSNLCRDKGFFDVVAVFERLALRGENVVLRLAGPPIDGDVEAELARLAATWPDQVTHVGAVYGDAKVAFYRGIDVFLFPTRHPQEAQPNVIYEALAAGVPVLATPRGCIPDMLGAPFGDVAPSEPEFVDWCEATLRNRFSVDRARRTKILQALRAECEAARKSYVDLLTLLCAKA